MYLYKYELYPDKKVSDQREIEKVVYINHSATVITQTVNIKKQPDQEKKQSAVIGC